MCLKLSSSPYNHITNPYFFYFLHFRSELAESSSIFIVWTNTIQFWKARAPEMRKMPSFTVFNAAVRWRRRFQTVALKTKPCSRGVQKIMHMDLALPAHGVAKPSILCVVVDTLFPFRRSYDIGIIVNTCYPNIPRKMEISQFLQFWFVLAVASSILEIWPVRDQLSNSHLILLRKTPSIWVIITTSPQILSQTWPFSNLSKMVRFSTPMRP